MRKSNLAQYCIFQWSVWIHNCAVTLLQGTAWVHCWIQQTAIHAIWRRQEHAYWNFLDRRSKISKGLQLPTSPNLTLPDYVREVVLTKICTKKKPTRKQKFTFRMPSAASWQKFFHAISQNTTNSTNVRIHRNGGHFQKVLWPIYICVQWNRKFTVLFDICLTMHHWYK